MDPREQSAETTTDNQTPTSPFQSYTVRSLAASLATVAPNVCTPSLVPELSLAVAVVPVVLATFRFEFAIDRSLCPCPTTGVARNLHLIHRPPSTHLDHLCTGQ